MSQRRAQGERERLARRAAGGDVEAARRLVALLEGRTGVTLSPDVSDLVRDALLAASRLDHRNSPTHRQRTAARLAAAALGAMLDPKADVAVLRRSAEPETCRFCGEAILLGPTSGAWMTESTGAPCVVAGQHEPTLFSMCAHCDHFVTDNDPWHAGLARHMHMEDGEQEFDHDAEPGAESMTSVDWYMERPELFMMFPDGKVGPNSAFFPGRRGKVE